MPRPESVTLIRIAWSSAVVFSRTVPGPSIAWTAFRNKCMKT